MVQKSLSILEISNDLVDSDSGGTIIFKKPKRIKKI